MGGLKQYKSGVNAISGYIKALKLSGYKFSSEDFIIWAERIIICVILKFLYN